MTNITDGTILIVPQDKASVKLVEYLTENSNPIAEWKFNDETEKWVTPEGKEVSRYRLLKELKKFVDNEIIFVDAQEDFYQFSGEELYDAELLLRLEFLID